MRVERPPWSAAPAFPNTGSPGTRIKPAGIADALGLAHHFVEDDKVMVMLADNVFERSLRPAVDAFELQSRGARILLSRLEDTGHLRHLGVAEFDGSGCIKRIVEKPNKPPSLFAVTGVYFYDASVFDVIARLSPSSRGELEITDVNNDYIETGAMQYDVIEGFWGDAGESIDAYYKVNDFVRQQAGTRVLPEIM